MKEFKKANGEKIENVIDYVKNYISIPENYQYEIYVGTDSKVTRNKVVYAIVIGIYKIGKGVHIIYRKEFRENKSFFERLWWEVEYSLQIANMLRDEGILTNNNLFAIHIDMNTNKKYKSSKVLDAASGYVKSNGFDFMAKPNAWVATYAADMLCK